MYGKLMNEWGAYEPLLPSATFAASTASSAPAASMGISAIADTVCLLESSIREEDLPQHTAIGGEENLLC